MNSVCPCCGKPLDEVESAFAFRRPLPYFMVPDAEREARVRHSDDVVIVDSRIFVIRGVMEIPLIDAPGKHFEWGLWATVSQGDFERYRELFDVDAENEPPFRGLMAVSPPNYPDLIDCITWRRWHEIVSEIYARQAPRH